MALTDWISEAASFIPLPGAGTAGQFVEDTVQSTSSTGAAHTESELSLALQAATAGDLAAFRNKIGPDWVTLRGWPKTDRHPSPAILSELITLSAGGLNGRYNTNERNIRDAIAALVTKYQGAPASGTDWGTRLHQSDPAPPSGRSGPSFSDQIAQLSPVTVLGAIAALWLVLRR